MSALLEKLRKGTRYLTDADYRFLVNAYRGKYDSMPDEEYLRRMFRAKLGRDLDLEHPVGFNEKLQWLKLYDRKPEYTVMVDKYKVRSYIAEKLGEEYLIPLLGVWEDPDDIDFDALPQQFVLKCNHNSGLGMCICRDKSRLDIPAVREELRRGLAENYYLTGREWPYKDVPRRIICEKYMTNSTGDSDLCDYKCYCFNGKMQIMMINSDRFSDVPTKGDYFDREFRHLDLVWGFPQADVTPEKPPLFEELRRIADLLSQGFRHLRVDLYVSGNRVYFGELTFFDGSGFDAISDPVWERRLGDWICLEQNGEE